MRLANDRELPDASPCLVFCGRPEADDDDEDDDCLEDELGAGIPERRPVYVDDEEEPCGLGLGLGLTVSCLILATGASWRGGPRGMALLWSNRFFRSFTLGAPTEGDLDVAADVRSRGLEAERMP
jgi:hypothetical protein